MFPLKKKNHINPTSLYWAFFFIIHSLPAMGILKPQQVLQLRSDTEKEKGIVSCV